MAELSSTTIGPRKSLWRRRRAMLLLCAFVGTMVFLTVIPTAWATPGEAPLNQTVPPGPAPYGGFLYYYYYGYGGAPNSYYPGYTTGYNAPCCSPDNSYPGGYYWPNYPSCGGSYGCNPFSTYW